MSGDVSDRGYWFSLSIKTGKDKADSLALHHVLKKKKKVCLPATSKLTTALFFREVMNLLFFWPGSVTP